MNDEIKELLDRIANYPEKLYCLNENEKHLLLDYITNLQEENEYNNYCNEKLREKITNLEYKIKLLQGKSDE